jgi:hypothetical protein
VTQANRDEHDASLVAFADANREPRPIQQWAMPLTQAQYAAAHEDEAMDDICGQARCESDR